MLMAHPTVLADLIEQYESLRVRHDDEAGTQARQRLSDVSYTLCVATGTRDITAALAAARRRIMGARPEHDAVRADAWRLLAPKSSPPSL
ncbi:DUF5133 domain-containing protein [Streptomyces sp. ADMS]|uniref:DUF5133 domain-containing protein n=1 Tax=Streptomyces sp. ADMS TaxID=3071415 RepID=UPI00296F7C92|nr:DUF5133 domain-containing protein [Streptomyces sp. ADMS]MDW4909522.1 DUF5133 domain-containing protein [Streptomyces sp. ADMS]